MHRLAAALSIVLACLAWPATASAKWTRLTSEHFVFISDTSDGEMRLIAQRLEQFRAVVGRVFSDKATNSPVPTVVVVFQDDRSFTPFKPVFNGRPVAVAGYFVGMEDANYIAVNAAQERDAYGIVFHEYAHFLTGSAVGVAPVWVSEGLAELYQTFEAISGGRTATIGRPSRQNLQVLAAAPALMPVAQLLDVGHDSPLYNEGDRRSLFYAESWALVHYLTFGGPARAGQLTSYLSAIGQGVPAADAFSRAFGQDTTALDRELQRYVRAGSFPALRLDFDDRIASASTSPGRSLQDSDAAGYLGDLLARLNRADDARAYLRRTIEGDAGAARALAALGLLELRASNGGLAFQLLEQAAALAPGDATIQSAFGRALTRRADGGAVDEDVLYVKARIALGRALELEPDNISTAVTLAEVEMGSGANPAKAVALMQRAVRSAPGREEYRLLLAQALAVGGDFKGASDHLGVLLARGSRPDVREAARQALTRVAEAQDAVRDLARLPDDAATASRLNPPAAGPLNPPRETLRQGSFEPTLRSVRAGESRVIGVFSTIECRPAAIVLQVDSANGAVRLAVKNFDEVEFLTYRQDAPAPVACGAQRPAYRVLATFRTDAPLAGANTPNRAVAIELLPDGYSPR